MSPAANCDRSGRDLGRACGTTHARQTVEASNVKTGAAETSSLWLSGAEADEAEGLRGAAD